MSIIVTSTTKRLLTAIICIAGFVLISAAFASVGTIPYSSTSRSIHAELNDSNNPQTPPYSDQIIANNNSSKTVQVDEQKLLKLSLLTAQYRQAYEETRLKLKDAIKLNEEMVKTMELQMQLINDMRIKIEEMEKKVKVDQSHNDSNSTVPAPHPANNEVPIS